MCFIYEIARFQLKNAKIQMVTKPSVLLVTKTFVVNSLVIVQLKNINFVWVGMPDFQEQQEEK